MATTTAGSQKPASSFTGERSVEDSVSRKPSHLRNNSIEISLKRRHNSLSSYQSTCISKHYALNNQILAAFESHYRNELWLVAYHVGLKFLETALLEIPKHGYFYAHKWSRLRLQSTVDALRVSHALQDIVVQEPKALANECHKLERLHFLATEQYEDLDHYEPKRKLVKAELDKIYSKEFAAASTGHLQHGGHSSIDSVSSFTSTLLACGDSFASVLCPVPPDRGLDASGTHVGTPLSEPPPARKTHPPRMEDDSEQDAILRMRSREEREPRGEDSGTLARPDNSDRHSIRSTGSLLDQEQVPHPSDESRVRTYRTEKTRSRRRGRDSVSDQMEQPQLPLRFNSVQTPTPSLEQASVVPPPPALRQETSYDLQRVLFLSGLQVDLPPSFDKGGRELPPSDTTSEVSAPPGAKKKDANQSLSVQMLSDCYKDDFDSLVASGDIQSSSVPTYQGRIPESTNGCTVIAPLLCIHHFHHDNHIPDAGLPDQVIVEVIDEETPNLLPVVRENLGLSKDAFIIPADAHESLMKQGCMCQEQFSTVCGGNILDETHLDAFLKELIQVGPQKVAASFFFHEHVITILQLRQDSNTVWFDVIDSLPHNKSNNASMVSSDMSTDEEDHSTMEIEPVYDRSTNASRTRCMSVDALKAAILWHACSAFTQENQAYIDSYQWDERLVDFDPRVFQAFVWTEA